MTLEEYDKQAQSYIRENWGRWTPQQRRAAMQQYEAERQRVGQREVEDKQANKERKARNQQNVQTAAATVAGPLAYFGAQELFEKGGEEVAKKAAEQAASQSAGSAGSSGASAAISGGGGSGGAGGGGGAAATEPGVGQYAGPAVAGAAMAYEVSEIYRKAGDKWAEEAEHKADLKKRGIQLLDESELSEDFQSKRGFENSHYYRDDLPKDFVGYDSDGKWVNNKFWGSAIEGKANEAYLTPKDTEGAAAWADRYGNDWAKATPEARAKVIEEAQRRGLVNRTIGRFQLTGPDKLKEELDAIAAEQGITRDPHASQRDIAREKNNRRRLDKDDSSYTYNQIEARQQSGASRGATERAQAFSQFQGAANAIDQNQGQVDYNANSAPEFGSTTQENRSPPPGAPQLSYGMPNLDLSQTGAKSFTAQGPQGLLAVGAPPGRSVVPPGVNPFAPPYDQRGLMGVGGRSALPVNIRSYFNR